jgi:hypothetical protein
MIIMKGVGAGKWSVDLGLLLAGPIAHIIILMARGYDIDYEMGFSGPPKGPTRVFFKEARKIDRQKAKEAGEDAREGGEVISELAGAGFLQTAGAGAPEGVPEGSSGPADASGKGFLMSPDLAQPSDGAPGDIPETEML